MREYHTEDSYLHPSLLDLAVMFVKGQDPLVLLGSALISSRKARLASRQLPIGALAAYAFYADSMF